MPPSALSVSLYNFLYVPAFNCCVVIFNSATGKISTFKLSDQFVSELTQLPRGY